MYKPTNYYKLIKQTNRLGNTYYYYYCYDSDGTRLKRATGKKTKTEANKVIAERIEQGRLHYPDEYKPKKQATKKKALKARNTRKNVLFSEYTVPFFVYNEDPVIQNKIRRGGSYSKTFCKNNRLCFEKHILPYFEKYKVKAITPNMINEWILDLPDLSGLSAVSCNKMRTLLSTILKQAVIDGIIERNPVDLVLPLRELPSKKGAFTREEVHDLFSCEWKNHVARLACLTSAMTGMRLGEIRGLSIDKVSTLKIIVDASYEDLEGLKTTKTGASREVPIPNSLYQLLDALSEEMTEGPYLFSLDFGKSPFSKSFIQAHLKDTMKKAGIDYRNEKRVLSFHSFRHFFNTSLIAAGVSGEITRAIIGHEDEEMTKHYLHLSADHLDCIRNVQELIINY